MEFPSVTVLSLFIPTFFMVSITPGMCMTLAMTLGMRFGLRAVAWMMIGELIGVATVALLSVAGVAAIMTQNPSLFTGLKILGAGYLIYTAYKMWISQSKVSQCSVNGQSTSPKQLFAQGLLTAIGNPKGWAFMIALLPPFINPDLKLIPQISVLLLIILLSEFICMMIYATGGKALGKLLNQGNNVVWMNRISAGLLFMVAMWLLVSG